MMKKVAVAGNASIQVLPDGEYLVKGNFEGGNIGKRISGGKTQEDNRKKAIEFASKHCGEKFEEIE